MRFIGSSLEKTALPNAKAKLYNFDKDQWEFNLKSLTNYQETLGSYTQTDMVYLQDYMSQYNSFMQGANSSIQNTNDTLTAILRG